MKVRDLKKIRCWQRDTVGKVVPFGVHIWCCRFGLHCTNVLVRRFAYNPRATRVAFRNFSFEFDNCINLSDITFLCLRFSFKDAWETPFFMNHRFFLVGSVRLSQFWWNQYKPRIICEKNVNKVIRILLYNADWNVSCITRGLISKQMMIRIGFWEWRD